MYLEEKCNCFQNLIPKDWKSQKSEQKTVSANSTRSGQAVGTRDPFHQELMVVVLSFPRLPTHTTVGSWSHLTVGSWSQEAPPRIHNCYQCVPSSKHFPHV